MDSRSSLMVENRGSAKDAAFEMGAARINFIPGEKLIVLLIQSRSDPPMALEKPGSQTVDCLHHVVGCVSLTR